MQLLIDKGYTNQINSANKWGNMPLHRASSSGMVNSNLFKLINNVLKSEIFGFFLLGQYNTAKLLIDNGANINYANDDLWSPLHTASLNGKQYHLDHLQKTKIHTITDCAYYCHFTICFLNGIIVIHNLCD